MLSTLIIKTRGVSRHYFVFLFATLNIELLLYQSEYQNTRKADFVINSAEKNRFNSVKAFNQYAYKMKMVREI